MPRQAYRLQKISAVGNIRTILFPWVILIATMGSLHVRAISQIHQAPLVLMGDFNATPDKVPVQIISAALTDASAISAKPLYGPPGTSNGFRDDAILRRIDYIFCVKIKVLSYAHIDDRRDDNGHVSDHLPVLAGINLTF
jgi:endonuclease/exonuclease/phosphatase family metal-dependent hydrolase